MKDLIWKGAKAYAKWTVLVWAFVGMGDYFNNVWSDGFQHPVMHYVKESLENGIEGWKMEIDELKKMF